MEVSRAILPCNVHRGRYSLPPPARLFHRRSISRPSSSTNLRTQRLFRYRYAKHPFLTFPKRPPVAAMRNQPHHQGSTGTPRHHDNHMRPSQPFHSRQCHKPKTYQRQPPSPRWRTGNGPEPERGRTPWACHSISEIREIERRYIFFPKLVEERKWTRPYVQTWPGALLPPSFHLDPS